MFEHKWLDITQQLPQLFEPNLRSLVCFHELTLAECKLLDVRECVVFVISVMNVRGLGKVQLGVHF